MKLDEEDWKWHAGLVMSGMVLMALFGILIWLIGNEM
jgi:hypothetical protein